MVYYRQDIEGNRINYVICQNENNVISIVYGSGNASNKETWEDIHILGSYIKSNK